MRCPKCRQTDSFKVDLWEVNSFAADLDGGDITNCKHDDCTMCAIDKDGGTKCQICDYESASTEFVDGTEPFPVLKRPVFADADTVPPLDGTHAPS